MLLDAYDDYRARAKSWTKIHACGKKDRDAVTAARAALCLPVTSTATSTATVPSSAQAATSSTAGNSASAADTSAVPSTSAAIADTSVTIALSAIADGEARGGDKENSDISNTAARTDSSGSSGGASPPTAKKSKPIAPKAKVNRRL
jgi:hypothetical protein